MVDALPPIGHDEVGMAVGWSKGRRSVGERHLAAEVGDGQSDGCLAGEDRSWAALERAVAVPQVDMRRCSDVEGRGDDIGDAVAVEVQHRGTCCEASSPEIAPGRKVPSPLPRKTENCCRSEPLIDQVVLAVVVQVGDRARVLNG